MGAAPAQRFESSRAANSARARPFDGCSGNKKASGTNPEALGCYFFLAAGLAGLAFLAAGALVAVVVFAFLSAGLDAALGLAAMVHLPGWRRNT